MRTLLPEDILPLCELTRRTAMFREDEVETLGEVLADFLDANHRYSHRCLIETDGAGAPIGLIYFAPESMTIRGWNVWWIVVDANAQGKGLGSRLLAAAESAIADENGRLILIETSSLPKYEPTWRFYLRNGYDLKATVADYYADGDDMLIYTKRAAVIDDPNRIR